MAQLAAMNAEFDSIGVPGPSAVDKANNPFFQPDAAADNLSNRSSGIDFPSDQRLDDIEACIKDMLTTTQVGVSVVSVGTAHSPNHSIERHCKPVKTKYGTSAQNTDKGVLQRGSVRQRTGGTRPTAAAAAATPTCSYAAATPTCTYCC